MRTDAEGIVLRGMTTLDVRDGLRLSQAAGWNQREADWRFLLEENRGMFVAAVRGGRVIGTGGAMCYGTALGWVCMILVDPEERGRGIATGVMQAVLARLSGVGTVGLDATPHGQGVYARLGFVETGRLVRVEAVSARTTPVSALGVRPLGAADLARVLALDREVFGADRGELLRWAAREAPAWCVEEEGAISAYCFCRRGARARQIGPVVARDVATARALIAAALGAGAGERVVLDVPADRPEWLAALAEAGFARQRPLVRMYRAGPPPGRPAMQLAIFGPEFG